MDTSQQRPKQACDNCRRRKIKCSRDLPCDKCSRLLLNCSYGDILRRKGPKFRTLYPLAPSHPLSQQQQQPPQDPATAYEGYTEYTRDALSAPSSFFQYQHQHHYSPFHIVPSPPESSSTVDSEYSCNIRPYARRLTSPILLAHVNVFLKYLFPIMPVVRREELHRDSHHPERVSAQRYAFLAALCAATHIQLNLDGRPASDTTSAVDGRALMSGEELLAEAVRARNECDVVEEMNVESLLTSLFLFASYGNLNRQKQAWFYLCQATSMVFTLGLHRESTYTGLSIEDAEEKRRVFWLLFVTERGYALQQSKPVMLRTSIAKPQVLGSDDPILVYGFLNLINLFEKLTVSLYDWLSAGNDNGNDSAGTPASSIQLSLCNAPVASLQGVLEIQQVDILITQQWLQAMMWKLSRHGSGCPADGSGLNANAGAGAMLPLHLPITVGKAVMNVIGAASQGAVDAHGIGMEQKLFDLGSTLTKVTPASTSTSTSTSPKPDSTNPRELLWGILTTLSRIRGSQSYLFPRLLEQAKGVLGIECSITVGDYLPSLGAVPVPVSGPGSVAGGGDGAAAPTAIWPNDKRNQWVAVAESAELEGENGEGELESRMS